MENVLSTMRANYSETMVGQMVVAMKPEKIPNPDPSRSEPRTPRRLEIIDFLKGRIDLRPGAAIIRNLVFSSEIARSEPGTPSKV